MRHLYMILLTLLLLSGCMNSGSTADIFDSYNKQEVKKNEIYEETISIKDKKFLFRVFLSETPQFSRADYESFKDKVALTLLAALVEHDASVLDFFIDTAITPVGFHAGGGHILLFTIKEDVTIVEKEIEKNIFKTSSDFWNYINETNEIRVFISKSVRFEGDELYYNLDMPVLRSNIGRSFYFKKYKDNFFLVLVDLSSVDLNIIDH